MLVYALRNRTNGKVYIGKTERTLEQRWQVHVSTARRGRGGCPYLGSALRKYGPEAFQRTVLFYAKDKSELPAAETAYILAFRSNEPDRGYNLTLGGDGTVGYKHTEETKVKLSEAKRGKTRSEEHKRKIGDALRGRTVSAETRRKISEANRGKPISEERLRKLNEARLSKPVSAETRQKQREASTGKTQSAETRRKISEANRGERNRTAKLTATQVSAMREEHAFSDITQTALAAKYGVTPSAVGFIVNYETWRVLPTVEKQ